MFSMVVTVVLSEVVLRPCSVLCVNLCANLLHCSPNAQHNTPKNTTLKLIWWTLVLSMRDKGKEDARCCAICTNLSTTPAPPGPHAGTSRALLINLRTRRQFPCSKQSANTSTKQTCLLPDHVHGKPAAAAVGSPSGGNAQATPPAWHRRRHTSSTTTTAASSWKSCCSGTLAVVADVQTDNR